MDNIETQKLYESARGFEDQADAANEAAQLKSYCDTHTRCSNNHHRPVEDIDKPCPVCGSCVPFQVESYPNGEKS